MRFAIPTLVFVALCLGSAQADAASCSSFAIIKSFDAEKSAVEVSYEKGKMKKYFPKPEGAPTDTSKIPKKCKRKVTKTTNLVVKAKGGRMTITQIRSNFDGKMLNDKEDAEWLPKFLQKLVTDQTPVVIVVRPGIGKDAPLGITTVYMPITDEEKAEIKRLDEQAEDA